MARAKFCFHPKLEADADMKNLTTCRAPLPTLMLMCFVCLFYAPTITASNTGDVDPLTRLQGFLQMRSFEASFSQTVYDAKHSVIDDSSGTFVLWRPGRFRWEYISPDRQVIVSDGINLITYDPELRQASVQPVAEALGDAPIAMLMGEKAINDRFEVRHGKKDEKIDWVLLTPKVQDIEFTRIELGLDEEKLVEIKMLDHFEQTTIIVFLHSTLNPPVSIDMFHLYLPPTVDVIGEYMFPLIMPEQP